MPLLLGQVELLAAEQVELEVGGRLADERRLGARWPARGRRAVVAAGDLRLGGVLELPLLVGELGRGLLDGAADQELVDLVEADLAGARARRSCRRGVRPAEPLGEEGQADAVAADGLHAGRRGRRSAGSAVGLAGVELVGVEPDDPDDPVARDVLGLQADLDLERLVVHRDHPAAEVVAVPRADQVGRRALLLHPGQGEQPLALGLVELDVGVGSAAPARRP